MKIEPFTEQPAAKPGEWKHTSVGYRATLTDEDIDQMAKRWNMTREQAIAAYAKAMLG